MIRKTSLIAAAVLGVASFAAAADNTVVYVNGHNTSTIVRTQSQPQAPYALTGSERPQKSLQTENIWVGNRIAGARVVQK